MAALDGKKVLITGASAGIGAAATRALTAAGAEVHAVARRADRLADLAAETGCHTHAADVTEAADRAALAEAVSPDILINNAGIGAGITGLIGASAEEVERTISTNVTAMLLLLRLFLPGMVERGTGHVVNIGSVAGLYPTVSAVYGASKGAVRLLGQNLRIELKGTGVRVTEIQPGRVRTEFYDAAIADPALRDKVKETGVTELTPEDIAAAILYAVTAPGHVNISAIELQPLDQLYGGVQFARG